MLALSSAASPAVEPSGPTFDSAFIEPWRNLYESHPAVAAAILVPVGLAFLLWGFRLYRWLVVLAYVGIGIMLGLAAAEYFAFNPSVGIMVGAIVLGVLAWPLHRLGWGLLGGLVFATALVAAASLLGIESRLHLALIGVVAFVAGVGVTLLLMKPIIIVITALGGAGLVAAGVLRLTMLWPVPWGPISRTLDARPYVFAVIVLVLAAVGSVLQVFDTAKKKKKKRPAGNGD